MDTVLASSFRTDRLAQVAHTGGGGKQMVADAERDVVGQYVWRRGRIEVTLSREGDAWRVVSSSSGRLFGPREVLYDAKHKQAKHAAWDVMACVIRASRNEDEGVNAGREAARWMTARV